MAAPLIALARTDRFLFLLNFASFCLLPGLLFSTLRRLGVAASTAWAWRWMLPTGYGFLLQAGSIGNDLFGAIFVLAYGRDRRHYLLAPGLNHRSASAARSLTPISTALGGKVPVPSTLLARGVPWRRGRSDESTGSGSGYQAAGEGCVHRPVRKQWSTNRSSFL